MTHVLTDDTIVDLVIWWVTAYFMFIYGLLVAFSGAGKTQLSLDSCLETTGCLLAVVRWNRWNWAAGQMWFFTTTRIYKVILTNVYIHVTVYSSSLNTARNLTSLMGQPREVQCKHELTDRHSTLLTCSNCYFETTCFRNYSSQYLPCQMQMY